jgi:hypothetical protein
VILQIETHSELLGAVTINSLFSIFHPQAEQVTAVALMYSAQLQQSQSIAHNNFTTFQSLVAFTVFT